MASNIDFVEYACNQISDAGKITFRKMFGEYGIYCDSKVIGVICENQLFIKKTIAGSVLLPSLEEAAPYTGAKPHFVIDNLDDKDLLVQFIRKTWDELPTPKPKKKKKTDDIF